MSEPVDELSRETAAVLRALRERDENTSAHCGRTCALALETGRACALSSAELAVLRWAAELHDIGKIGIPDRILHKPGRLDADELALMRTHPSRGHAIIDSIPDPRFAAIARVVLCHHEDVDGGGYPQGLRGEWELRPSRAGGERSDFHRAASRRHGTRSTRRPGRRSPARADRTFAPARRRAFA